jgi:LmbE family N-acetylglucosaminyl deacetylase
MNASAPHPFHCSSPDELELSATQDIAVLAPHPDDFDAIAVSLQRLHQRGHAIHVAVLTTGANGIEDGWEGAQSDEEKAAIREAEQRASCTAFGLPLDRLSFLRLWQDDSDAARVAADHEALRSFLLSRPWSLVFLPHGNDSNRTHRRTWESFESIALAERLKLRACLCQDAKTLGMRADLHTFFSEEEAAWKGQLLRMHRSQHERNLKSRGYGFDQRVLDINREAARRAQGAMPYAEAFELRVFD